MGTMRNAPVILDNFSTLLKDNRYVVIHNDPQQQQQSSDDDVGEERLLSSMADGFERSRYLRSVLVRIADVTPLGENRYVAITTLKMTL
ncbi:hypothetical protein F4860DRAFT_491739 [Xylaria cubensis]|nr:hypothetical protein F4860DRAFT_491739 [Xylaria cubensis]